MSVLRAAAIEGLRQAVKRRRLVVAADPASLARARTKGRLAIDARVIAEALRQAEPGLFDGPPPPPPAAS